MIPQFIGRPPEPGQIVQVRHRRYLVEDVVPPPERGDATLVRMACVDDDAQGQPLEVLWEREVDAQVLTTEAWGQVASRGFDAPGLFSAYMHTLRWNCVTATDARLFQAPFRAGIRVDAYQLEPLRKALRLPRVNLFIADDVGLGKTIEAGLITRELLLRRKVRDIVVACPPSMLVQWQEEMEARFGLSFQILDKEYVARVRQERGYGVNPWTTHTRFLVSHRLLVDEAYAGPLRDWLRDFRPGALLVLDEAHHAAPSSGARYAIDSKITHAVRDLARRFEHRLFLSATPHNGHSNSFSALLEILDPQRFIRGMAVTNKKLLDDVMVRRLKDDVREVAGGFPRREVVQVDVAGLPADTPELVLSELLDQYRRLREERLAGESKRTQAAAGLLLSGLQQRLLSSIEAFARTLRVHRRTMERAWTAGSEAAAQPPRAASLDLLRGGVGSDDDRATLSEDELWTEEEAQIEAATAATAGQGAGGADPFAEERALLDRMTEVAEASRGAPDARVLRLVAWIREHMCAGLPEPGEAGEGEARWNGTRVLIFTEYEDTRRYLYQQLSAVVEGTDRGDARIDYFHGPTPAARREEIKRAFNADPAKHPLRILIATDAAREGLNLQRHCWNLFHFDVPWNPSRLEQRNGRIDRKLQPNEAVFCHYFVYAQRTEDRILRALVRKTEKIKEELGSLAQVVESRLTDTLGAGIRHADVARLEREIDGAALDAAARRTMQEELEQARDRQDELRGQIDRVRRVLDESARWIGLREDHFRAAMSSALQVMGAPGLQPLDGVREGAPARFAFPALDRRDGADSTWAEAMDALRAPRRRDQDFWSWRRESPVRPVVFADSGELGDEAVHLHLEHRLVRRLLGRFTAQGFVHHDLSRACVAHSVDAIPRVVLLGRLTLYGPEAARLHEEIVPITARWVDPVQRKGALAPYGREAEGRALQVLEEALLPRGGRAVEPVVADRLRASVARDVEELLPRLEERGETYAAEARAKLTERGRVESEEMRKILEEQVRRLQRAAAERDDAQLSLTFDAEERRQVESERRHWGNRLAELGAELEREPERIRALYEVRAQRVEPVGVVYLWPVTG